MRSVGSNGSWTAHHVLEKSTDVRSGDVRCERVAKHGKELLADDALVLFPALLVRPRVALEVGLGKERAAKPAGFLAG